MCEGNTANHILQAVKKIQRELIYIVITGRVWNLNSRLSTHSSVITALKIMFIASQHPSLALNLLLPECLHGLNHLYPFRNLKYRCLAVEVLTLAWFTDSIKGSTNFRLAPDSVDHNSHPKPWKHKLETKERHWPTEACMYRFTFSATDTVSFWETRDLIQFWEDKGEYLALPGSSFAWTV